MTGTGARWCPTGQHWQPMSRFRISTNGRPARDCHDCEVAKRERPNAKKLNGKAIADEFPGVDIDAIHYKRGAIRKGEP